MKKIFEEPQVSVIHFSMQEAIAFDNAGEEEMDTPGFSVVIDEW